MQDTIEQTTPLSREQQRYEDFESQRRLTDELTEASEKLAMVMSNSFEFELKPDGELYFQGQSVGEVLRRGVAVMEEIVKTKPQFITELIRNRIELQEYDDIRRLALGSDGDPDVLVVQSPIPDAVLHGADLGAYDVKRKKTIDRIYERTDKGVRSTTISLDQSDRAGLQAVARQFGESIPEYYGSEDILAMRLWGYSKVLHDPVKTVRRRYDEQLERRHGGVWYGGRQDGEVLDALSFITSQPDIIQAHMASMKEIDGNDNDAADKRPLYKEARYNFAAALDRRRHGASTLGDGGDLAGSGNAARGAGIEYESDCADGSVKGQDQSAVSAVDTLFGRKNKEFMSKACPMCGEENVRTVISGEIISGSCGCARNICTGEELSINRRAGQGQPAGPDNSIESSGGVQEKQGTINPELVKRFGEYAAVGQKNGVGGTYAVVYDRRTDEVITTI